MKNVMMIVLSLFLLSTVVATPAQADANKGKKYFIKYLKPLFKIKGAEFCGTRTKGEWKAYFRRDAKKFIKKYSKKYPVAKDFLKGDKFQKIAPHVKDFAVKFAADSGAVPSCN